MATRLLSRARIGEGFALLAFGMVIVSVIFALLTQVSIAVPTVSEDILDNPVPNQEVLSFDPNSSREERLEYIESIGGTVVEEVEALDTIVVWFDPARNASDSDAGGEVVEELPESELVAAVEPNYYVGVLQEQNRDMGHGAWDMLSDEFVDNQWYLSSLNKTVDEPQTVAVIDSGVCLDHPDLEGKLLEGYDFVEDDSTPQDEFDHGCGVAGVIAAVQDNEIGIAGLTVDTQILPVRVLDADGVGTYSDVAAGIVYAVDNGVDTINLSLGGFYDSTILKSAIDYAIENDVRVVAAAGNQGQEGALYPAKYDEVIAVGSVNQDGDISSFSNYGSDIDAWAAGEMVYTTMSNGEYGYVSGTSIASAVVSAGFEMEDNELESEGGEVLGLNPENIESYPLNPQQAALERAHRNMQVGRGVEDILEEGFIQGQTSETVQIAVPCQMTYLTNSSTPTVEEFNSNRGHWVKGNHGGRAADIMANGLGGYVDKVDSNGNYVSSHTNYYSCGTDTNAMASISGRIHTYYDNGGGGNVLQVIDDNAGLVVEYVHLDSYSVQEGDVVTEGQQVGVIGESGCPGCGVHLHLNIYKNGAKLSYNSIYSDLDNQWEFRDLQSQNTRYTTNDFDNDEVTDLTLYRPSDSTWYTLNSKNYFGQPVSHGLSGDIPIVGDFDGDGFADRTAYRPSNYMWYTLLSNDGERLDRELGRAGDYRLVGDIDGDGIDDPTTYRSSNRTFYSIKSSDGQRDDIGHGLIGDRGLLGDFDGDGIDDRTVFRQSNGMWYTILSSNGQRFDERHGDTGDIPLIGDFDGDGKADHTVYRPSNQMWLVLKSSDGERYDIQYGRPYDLPFIGDFDGDGKTDHTIYRPAFGKWYTRTSSDLMSNNFVSQHSGSPVVGDFDGDGKDDYMKFSGVNGEWLADRLSLSETHGYSHGLTGDIPVTGDFDGDGIVDRTVYRPSNGMWYIVQSSDGKRNDIEHGGEPGDIPLPADFDGDGIYDLTVYRPSDNKFYTLKSSDEQRLDIRHGDTGDIPFVGDFDGDGISDHTVFRPSTQMWLILQSANGQRNDRKHGIEGDIPFVGDYDGDGLLDRTVFRPSNEKWYTLKSSDGKRLDIEHGEVGDEFIRGDFDGDGRDDHATYRPSNNRWYIKRSSDGERMDITFGESGDIAL